MRAEDTRTLAELAREALTVQDACNLSGVVLSFGRAVCRLRALLPDASTDRINRHPICQAWADKVASLAGVQNFPTAAYDAFRQLEWMARGELEQGTREQGAA